MKTQSTFQRNPQALVISGISIFAVVVFAAGHASALSQDAIAACVRL